MYYVNKNIKELYRVKYHDQRGSVLRLDMNENPSGLPSDFVEQVKRKITPEFLATYPEKDSLAELLAKYNNINIENVTITNGSDEAMRLVFQCFGEENKNVLTVSPTFEMYDVYSKMFGMQHVQVEYDENFEVSLATIIDKIDDKTSLIIILNPNSPIGTVFLEEDVETIVQKAKQENAIVVIDEAYYYYYEKTFLNLINKYDNVVILRTFSKLCSMAGLRIGYAMANSKIIEYLEKAESTFNVNNVAILFAEELLQRKDILEAAIKKEKEGRLWLAETMQRNGYKILVYEGCYLLFKPKMEASHLVEKMKKKNVWLRDYKRGVLAGWVRVSTGAIEYMKMFWECLLEVEES